MSLSFRLLPRAWIVVLLGSCGFLGGAAALRMQRVDYVSSIGRPDTALDFAAPAGSAAGKRWLIVPEHNNPTYQWLQETEQMLAQHTWRVRRIDYENAPFGRAVHSASPYHWWLGLLARCHQAVTGQPLGVAVERAALFADPLLQVLLLVGATILVARRFGSLPAALLAAGLAAEYPLAAAFLPGVATEYGLTQVCALGSLLLLLAGCGATRKSSGWFFAAGAAGGGGLWVNASDQGPILAGIFLGGCVAAAMARRSARATPTPAAFAPPWRAWAVGGAAISVLGYLIENFPGQFEWQLRVNHPIYALAWLGAGELLAQWSSGGRWGQSAPVGRRLVRCALAAAAVAAVPVALYRGEHQPVLAGDLLASRLTNLPDGVVAGSLGAWLRRDGLSAPLAATCLPLLLLIPVAWLLTRRAISVPQRTTLALALGPVAVTVLLAVQQLRWWSMADSALLALLVAAAAALPPTERWRRRWLSWGLVAATAALGLTQVSPAVGAVRQNKFTHSEVEEFYERAVAHWLADRAGPDGAVVLVPPYRTSSFCFYGGLRGLGTQNWDNRAGIAATVRIVTATRPDEIQALLSQRTVKYVVIPAWDTDLETFASLALKQPENSFIVSLDHWVLFNWMRALPYQLPAIAGFDAQKVVIFELTDEVDRATAISRLTEYFVEMQQFDLAAATLPALHRYPADLGALVAIAQVEKARGDEVAFRQVLTTLEANLASGSDRDLFWDRRVSLAVVLALGGRPDLARAQTQNCLADLDEAGLRTLTTGTLYHLLVLERAYGLPINDPQLRALALQLLPAELRDRLRLPGADGRPGSVTAGVPRA